MEANEASAPHSGRDEELFVRLLTQHENDLYRYVTSLTFNASAVDDIMQEVALALWNKFDQFDPQRPFVPWACRFAYFQVLKHRSKVGRSRLVFGDKLVESLASDYEDEEELIRARREALEACLGKLRDSDRELVELRYGSEETVQEAAKGRGLSVHKLYHALDRIRRNLMLCTQKTLQREGYEVTLPRPRDQAQLESLLSAYCDSRLDDAGERQLADILGDDPEARRFYLHYIDQHLEIARRAARSNIVPVSLASGRKATHLWKVFAAAAAALAVVTGALLWQQSREPDGVSGTRIPIAAGPIAFVSRAEEVVWNYPSAATAGLELDSNDSIEMTSGKVRIEFFDGSSATIVAPASFTFYNSREIELRSGQIVVRSDGPTSGFTVRTPGAAFVDVGTEFALAVIDSIGTKMRVIEGEVIATLLSEDDVALDERSAFAGEYLTVDPYDGIADADLEAAEFPEMLAPAALPLNLPSAYVSAVIGAKPLGYWRFEELEGTGVVDEIEGGHPAVALGRLRLEGGKQGNRTVVLEGDESERGLFIADAFAKFSTDEYSVELWFNSQSQQHSGLVSLVEIDADSLDAGRRNPLEHRMMALECTGGERSRWSRAPQGKVSFAHRLRKGFTERDTGSRKDREKRGGGENRDRRHKRGDREHGQHHKTSGDKKERPGGHSRSRYGKDSDNSHDSGGGRYAAGYRDYESRVYSRAVTRPAAGTTSSRSEKPIAFCSTSMVN